MLQNHKFSSERKQLKNILVIHLVDKKVSKLMERTRCTWIEGMYPSRAPTCRA